MKITLLIALFTCLTFLNVTAQESFPEGSEGNNELKINLLYVVLEVVELDYERITSDNFSVGMAVNYWFAEYSEYNFMVTPYFRFYPAEKLRASGFFIEGNMSVVGHDQYEREWVNGFWTGEEVSKVSVGGGLAAGGKFISKSGLFAEVFAGVGRIFHDHNYPELYPRVGITLGKRF